MVKIAKKENAKYVAHGCTGKGNDQVRFELTFNILAPELKVIAPVRVWSFKSREEQIDYCKKNHIPVEATKKSPYSIDKNLWGASIECGVLEDIKKAPPEDAYMLTRSPQNAPEKAQKIEIYFKKGVPVKINGKKTSSVELINKLNKLAGKHAIGRSDLVEDRVVGIKSREIYEAPAATILTFAHKELEGLVLDKKTLDFKKLAELTYSQVIYSGFYFSPLKKALDVFIDETQKPATGTIKLKLYKGNIATVSRQSENSLYSKKLATYKKEDIFDQSLAEGFIKILALPYKRIKDSH
jgi:argininosuccinate synthase